MRHGFAAAVIISMALPGSLHSMRWPDWFEGVDELEEVGSTLSLLQKQLYHSGSGHIAQSSKMLVNASKGDAEQCPNLLPVLKRRVSDDDALDLMCQRVFKKDACRKAGVVLKKRSWSTEAITEACKWLETPSVLQTNERTESLLLLRSSTVPAELGETGQRLDESLESKEDQPYVRQPSYAFNKGWWVSNISKDALVSASKAAEAYLMSTTTTTTTTTNTMTTTTMTMTTASTTTTTTTTTTALRLQPEGVLYGGVPYFGPSASATPKSIESGDPRNADYEDVTVWDVPPGVTNVADATEGIPATNVADGTSATTAANAAVDTSGTAATNVVDDTTGIAT